MAWIYLAESEDSQKPWKATSGQSPIVRTIDTLLPFYSPGCGPAIYPALPYGPTFKPSELANSRTSTSSTADSPAKTLAVPDAEKAWAASEADYFSRSSGSAARYDPDSSSWRTSQQLLFEEQNELLESFAASGMTVDGAFYPLRMWARITGGNDGGFWRTPLGTDGEKMGHGNLPHQIKMLPTPAASSYGSNQGGAAGRTGKVRPGLESMARSGMWPTPNASDGMGGRIPAPGAWERKKVQIGLNYAVKMWPTPIARDSRSLKGARRMKGAMGTEPLVVQVGGQLNPTWVEWLMGYPSEWTVLKDWAIAWFRPKRGKRLKG